MLCRMHEWALAEAVLEAAASAAGPGSRLRSVTVRIGELQSIDREIFSFALAESARDGALAGASFIMETEPASFRCRGCGRGWLLAEAGADGEQTREAIHFLPESAHAFLRCPSCGGPDFTVETGRGVTIASVELEDGEA
jgi:hydrogenase nickel incorporation protein HypA/HybF